MYELTEKEKFVLGVSPSARLDEDFRKLKFSKFVGAIGTDNIAITLNVFLMENTASWEIYNTETTDLIYKRIKTRRKGYFLKRSKEILHSVGLKDDELKRPLDIASEVWDRLRDE